MEHRALKNGEQLRLDMGPHEPRHWRPPATAYRSRTDGGRSGNLVYLYRCNRHSSYSRIRDNLEIYSLVENESRRAMLNDTTNPVFAGPNAAPDEPLDVLVVAPHPDDAELGVGGTILHLLSRGWRVGVLDLTSGEPTPHGSLETRAAETAAATKVLGLTWRGNLGLPNRSLRADLDARRLLAEAFRLARPRWLFAPYWQDAHPDHVAATQLIEDARFWAKLSKTDMRGAPFHPRKVFYYYCVHLKVVPQPAFIVDISDHCEQKLEAIACYTSQFVTGREDVQPALIDRLREEAGFWGRAIGVRFGEPIASREPLGLNDLSGLI